MTFLQRPSFLIVMGIFVLSQCSLAKANYVTESATMSTGVLTTDFTATLAMPTFNSSLGTLVNVIIDYSDSGTMKGFVDNTSAKAQNFSVKEDANVKLSYGTTALLTNDLIAQQSYTQLGSHQTSLFGTYNPSGAPAAPLTISSGPLFQAFLAPSSSVMLTFNTLTSTTVTGGGGNITTGLNTSAQATVTVEFVYQPFTSSVPEPSSLALVTIGGLALISTRLRGRLGRRRIA